MRRFTLITIIALMAALAVAAVIQLSFAGRGERRLPGPGASSPP